MARFAFPRFTSCSLLATSTLCLCPLAAAQTQPAASVSAGCVVLQETATCNWPAFKKVLASARVIAIGPSSIDRPVTYQLTALAHHLGKTVATKSMSADLTFTIVPTQSAGVSIGPGDQKILSLQIFSGPSTAGKLLWVETLTGDVTRPWSSNVYTVIEQFEDRLKHS